MNPPAESTPVTISVVIRAWNEAPELERLLEALAAQDYPKQSVELIVVDNGSTDGTESLAARYGARHVYLAQKDFCNFSLHG